MPLLSWKHTGISLQSQPTSCFPPLANVEVEKGIGEAEKDWRVWAEGYERRKFSLGQSLQPRSENGRQEKRGNGQQ